MLQAKSIGIAVLAGVTCREALGQSESVKRQIEAAKKQVAAVRQLQTTKPTASLDWVSEPEQDAAVPTAACDPIEPGELQKLVAGVATERVSSKLISAVIRQESANRPCAVSVKGAMGLMQLMPETAREMAITDPFDPQQNIQAGVRYLGQLLQRYEGDLARVLAAYNAGPARVDAANGVPNIAETQSYVKNIMARLQESGEGI